MLSAAEMSDPFVNELIRVLISGGLLVSLAIAACLVEWLITILRPDVDGANSFSKQNHSSHSAAPSLAHSSMMRVLRRTVST